MNKKVIMMMVLAVFLCNCFAFAAQGNSNTQGNSNNLVDGFKNGYETQEQNQAQYRKQSQVQGLERARLRVRNEEQVQHLEEVMAKIDENRKEMLNNLDELEVGFEEKVNSNIRAVGEKQAKFLGFLKVQKQFKYQINNNGEIFQVRNLWDKLFKE